MTPETLPPEPTQPVRPTGCANCNHPVIVPGYKTPLCETCRQAFIKYPIPKGIWLFAGAVALIMLFALFKTQQNMTAGIHFLRGKRAIKSSRYYTAEKEFKLVNRQMPNYTEAKEYLAIASFYNQHLDSFFSLTTQLAGTEVEDQELFAELDGLMSKVARYVPSDSFVGYFNKYPILDSIPYDELYYYLKTHPDDIYATLRFVNHIYDDTTQIRRSDSLLSNVLQYDNINFHAIYYKAGLKRQLKQYDSADYFSDRLLAINKESTWGMSSKARGYLRQKKDKEALEWALKSYKVNSEDDYARSTLALAYHFNNKTKERDELFVLTKNDSTSSMKFVHDVIAGKENFRDN